MVLTSGEYVVKSIAEIAKVNVNVAVFEVTFKSFEDSPVIYFGDRLDSLRFINREVIVNFRDEVYNGQLRQCINNITVPVKVPTIERDKQFKLYSSAKMENGSNVDFKDIEIGDMATDIIVYCKDHVYESSERSNWAKMTILDKNRRISVLRVFDPETKSPDFIGKYIQFTGKKTKFGFQATDVFIVEGLSLPVNPALTLAQEYISEFLKSDSQLADFFKKKNLLKAMSVYKFEEGEEVGSPTIKLAMALVLAREFSNLTPNINVQLLTRGIVLSYCYCLNNRRQMTVSRSLQNIIAISGTPFMLDHRIIVMLEEQSPVELLERELMFRVKSLVDVCFSASSDASKILASDKMWKEKK